MIKIDKNFVAFIWHAFWLSLAETFTEKNTVLPALILLNGGTQIDVGVLTSIMIGAPLISQLLFAGYLTKKPLKKKFLLGGIYLRVFAFLGVGFSIYYFENISQQIFINIIFLWMLLFALSGAFAGVSYSDIVGKSFDRSVRKKFFVYRQFLSSIGILISAFIVKQLLSNIPYPQNYQTAFLTAGILLFIASIGFMTLYEKASQISNNYKNVFHVLKSIPHEIRSNKTLKNFVIVSNLIGVSFVLTPFYVGFIKNTYTITNNEIGNFLLVQVLGMIFSNLLWNKIVSKISFKGIIKIAVILLASLPILTLLLSLLGNIEYYYFIFFLVGSAISAQKIANEGVIIEISNEANRPLYVGIIGTLNLTIAFFPLLLGLSFEIIGYFPIFISLSLITFSSLYFINKMVCPVDLEKVENL